jgi:hypothetical protein
MEILKKRRIPTLLFTLVWITTFLVPVGLDVALAGPYGAEIIADLVGSKDIAEISATGQAGCSKKNLPIASVLSW